MWLIVKRWIEGSMLAIAIGISAGMLPAQAQSDQQVRSLVEALRLAAPQTGNANDGLYSDWQIQAQNIPRWSESCIDRTLSPQEFEADVATARSILVCVMRDILQQEYRNSGNSEAIAVRRAAAWWMTGDASRYNAAETAPYTQRVLSFYQQQTGTPAATTQPNSTDQPESQAEERPAPPQSPPYDRYMQAGYAAVEEKNYDAALLHFQRALDERPNDTYAQQAIENVERYRTRTGQDQSEQEGAQ
jgi:TolA-binding protein